MNPSSPPPEDRLHELLADRALFGCSPEDQAELERLLAASPGTDAESLDRLAAQLSLSSLPAAGEPLPSGLRARLLQEAPRYLSSSAGAPRLDPTQPAASLEVRRLRWLAAAGWLAAAASLLVAVGLWWRGQLGEGMPSPAEQRQALLARRDQPGSDVIQIPWTATKDPAAKAAGGDVVWSNAAQQGFLHFHGLPANDPSKSQYQLWIIDKDRDDRYPVDGGVFDIGSAEQDIVVPIRATLPVGRPALFAVTLEKPGGVVVSTRERMALVAAVPR